MTALVCGCQKYSAAGWPVRCAACSRDDMTARGPAVAVELGTLPAGATSSTATGVASGRTTSTARGDSIDEHRSGAATPGPAATGDRIAQNGA